jgi:hypothetical protein
MNERNDQIPQSSHDLWRVLPHTVVDNSDTSPIRLTAWETLHILP